MKKCWVSLTEWNKDVVTESIESGVNAILASPKLVPQIRELGRIAVVSEKDGDLSIPGDVEMVEIKNKKDEEYAASALNSKTVIVRTTDWDIIPIENLIPRGGERLFTYVRNLEDTKLAAEIMEKGVAGIVLETSDPSVVSEVADYINRLNGEKIDLVPLEVAEVKNLGIGDRVCVDTCSNLNSGEGLLVGNSSSGMFLVHAENLENPYVAPRPFRVNAGAVHSYVRVPGNKTRYLGELSTGDTVIITDSEGAGSTVYVGRSKIEKRPMLAVFARDDTGKSHSVILQNAETIRLTGLKGEAISVAVLKPGDKILGYVEKGGRHFGMAVEETILEK
jgi:3-dehydroquinate synthase II